MVCREEMKIPFDTEGITSSCPVADAGIKNIEECGDCQHFIETDGFDVICSYGSRNIVSWEAVKLVQDRYEEPEQEE